MGAGVAAESNDCNNSGSQAHTCPGSAPSPTHPPYSGIMHLLPLEIVSSTYESCMKMNAPGAHNQLQSRSDRTPPALDGQLTEPSAKFESILIYMETL